MDNILIDIKTKKILNINDIPRVDTLEIKINDISLIEKNKVFKKFSQKTDNMGRKLYNVNFNGKNIITHIISNEYEYSPALIEEEIIKKIKFIANPQEFEICDIIDCKKNQLIANTEYNQCILDEMINLDYFDINNSNLVEIGNKLIRIHPNGFLLSNKININNKISKIKVYIESNNKTDIYIGNDVANMKLINNEITFDNSIDAFYVKFVNNYNVDININCYAFLMRTL